MESVDRAIQRVEKLAKLNPKEARTRLDALERLSQALNQGLPTRGVDLTPEERLAVRDLHLITMKPIMYIANIAEGTEEGNPLLERVRQFAGAEGAALIPLCVAVEAEIAQLDGDDRKEFLMEMGLAESGLDRVVRTGYLLLNLLTFFTAGKKEVRAWTVRSGSTAPQAAGRIHTDFEKGFIRAEVIAFEDFKSLGGEQRAKEAGKLRLEGKSYVVNEGDVMHFRFNI
jgi:GTP-binding protein YchF